MEVEGGSSPIPDLNAFRILTASGSKRKLSQTQQTFVKKLENIPSVALLVETCQTAINIAHRGLIASSLGFGLPLRQLQDGFIEIGNLSFRKLSAAI